MTMEAIILLMSVKENVKFIVNFPSYLFQMIAIKRGYIIDRIELPGITSSVLQKVSCSNSELLQLDKARVYANGKQLAK
jgi:hypothetical protein